MTKFTLKVNQINSVCHFELSWSRGQIISVTLDYPILVTENYQKWQQAYLDYYRQMRGRKVISGSGKTPIDCHKKLVDAEVAFLAEFHN